MVHPQRHIFLPLICLPAIWITYSPVAVVENCIQVMLPRNTGCHMKSWIVDLEMGQFNSSLIQYRAFHTSPIPSEITIPTWKPREGLGTGITCWECWGYHSRHDFFWKMWIDGIWWPSPNTGNLWQSNIIYPQFWAMGQLMGSNGSIPINE
jgi:hypothetical protein